MIEFDEFITKNDPLRLQDSDTNFINSNHWLRFKLINIYLVISYFSCDIN